MIAVHKHALVKRARRPAGPRSSAVEVTRVHPMAWRTALALAGRDRSRLRVLSATEVLVRNGGRS
jgi:hypothetical protein